MTKEQIFQAALRDAEDEDLETLEAGATSYDALTLAPHVHNWKPTHGHSRLVGDVWQHPHECDCGATAWKQNWCGKLHFVDIRTPAAAEMVQDDLWNTPLPNSSLRWFGFDFDRIRLPYQRLSDDEQNPKWVGAAPGFFCRYKIVDGEATVEVNEYQPLNDDDNDTKEVLPSRYYLTVKAHGLSQGEKTVHTYWHEVKQQYIRMERMLDQTHDDRHHICRDENDRPTQNACQPCELG